MENDLKEKYERQLKAKWNELQQAVFEYAHDNKTLRQLNYIRRLSGEYSNLCDKYIDLEFGMVD